MKHKQLMFENKPGSLEVRADHWVIKDDGSVYVQIDDKYYHVTAESITVEQFDEVWPS